MVDFRTGLARNASNEAQPGWVPAVTSAAAMRGIQPTDAPGASAFFDASAAYRGAFAPDGLDWAAGWTAYPAN